MKYCIHCGACVEDGTKYCPECGELVDGAPSAPSSQNGFSSRGSNSNGRKNTTSSSQTATRVLVTLGVVFAVAAGGALGFRDVLFRPHETDGPKEEIAQSKQDTVEEQTTSNDTGNNTNTVPNATGGTSQVTGSKTSEEEEKAKAEAEKAKAEAEKAAAEKAEAEKAKAEAEKAKAEAEKAKAEAEAEKAKAEAEAAKAQAEAEAARAQAEAEAAAAASAASSGSRMASSFPRTWNGTYDGHNGGEVLHRPITFHITDVGSNGSLYGWVEIYVAEDGVTASYNVSGEVNWDTGYLILGGVSWIDSSGLDNMRTYEGYVDFSSWYVSGTTWNDEGKNLENWEAHA